MAEVNTADIANKDKKEGAPETRQRPKPAVRSELEKAQLGACYNLKLRLRRLLLIMPNLRSLRKKLIFKI